MDAESKSVSPPAHAGGAPHLDRPLLLAYRAHRLMPEEELRVQRHLETCAACRELAVEVSAFFDPPEGEAEPSPAERSASWVRIEGNLAAKGWFAARRARQGLPAAQWAVLAAACLVLAVLGVSRYRLLGAQERVLVAVGAYKGSQGTTEDVRLPVILKLRLAAVEGPGPFRAVVAREEGRQAGSFRRLRRDSEGFVSVPLRRWSLPPGTYSLSLEPEDPRASGPRDEFRFQVVRR